MKLTTEIAMRCLAGEQLDLSEFTEIEDGAALTVGRLETRSLYLSGLANLSDAAAAVLAQREDDTDLEYGTQAQAAVDKYKNRG